MIDCKRYYQDVKDSVREQIKQFNFGNYKLKVIIVGNDPAAVAYSNGKKKDFEYIGCKLETDFIDTSSSCWGATFIQSIIESNFDENCAGIVVEFDKNVKIDHDFKKSIFKQIVDYKDVDGLAHDIFLPCTAEGTLSILKDYLGYNLEGQVCCVLGRSELVGKPIIDLLIKEGATVICCNSKTGKDDREEFIKSASVVICATGQPRLVDDHLLNSSQIVIDIGTTMINGKLVGDVNPETYRKDNEYAPYWYTSVPGGMGLVTRAVLLKHFVEACKKCSNTNSYLVIHI